MRSLYLSTFVACVIACAMPANAGEVSANAELLGDSTITFTNPSATETATLVYTFGGSGTLETTSTGSGSATATFSGVISGEGSTLSDMTFTASTPPRRNCPNHVFDSYGHIRYPAGRIPSSGELYRI